MFGSLWTRLLRAILPVLPASWKRRLLARLQPRPAAPTSGASTRLLRTLRDTPQPAPAPWTAPTARATPEPADAEPQRRTAYLVMVSAQNNNKFYRMTENDDGTFTARYGRVGTAGTPHTYPVAEWDRKHREKVSKGYVDHTHLFADSPAETELADIPDSVVRGLIQRLQEASRQSVRSHYNVQVDQVTAAQVQRAQALLDELVARVRPGMDLRAFNDDLLALYGVIPRRMTDVRDHLAHAAATEDERETLRTLLAHEQATLDVMAAEVDLHARSRAQGEEAAPRNVLDVLGLRIEPADDPTVVATIRRMMDREARRFHRAFRVENLRTQRAFSRRVATSDATALFWHGSRNENWMSILETGLVLRPANAVITGKMFGYGLYFADRFRKSLNYTSVRGSYWAGGKADRAFLAIFEVHTGRPLVIRRHASWCTQLDAAALRRRGSYDSVHAVKGVDLVNDEFIVYEQDQCTVRYLVEVQAT